MEVNFKAIIGERISPYIEVEYTYQCLDDLPPKYHVPPNRSKPWGTGHAVLAVRHKIDEPFAVINADDYYGPEAFSLIYEFLKDVKDDEYYQYAMAGYELENTLTENGYVSRGICEVNEQGYLHKINERTHIEKIGHQAVYKEGDKTPIVIPSGSTVSMNMWGFTSSILKELENKFSHFLEETIQSNPEKGEYFLPNVVGELIQENKARVRVLKTQDKWYGVTYKEDRPVVVNALLNMKNTGVYPEDLWKRKR